MLTRFIKSILLAAFFTSLASAPAEASGILPYIKITINNARTGVIGDRRVGFVRQDPVTFETNVFNFDGLQVKKASKTPHFLLFGLGASKQHLAWSQGFADETGFELDVYSFDKGTAKNISNTPTQIDDNLDVAGKNIVWTTFIPEADTYHVYLNKGGNSNNTVAVTEGYLDNDFRFRQRSRVSETGNIVWQEQSPLTGNNDIVYFDGEDDEIRVAAASDPDRENNGVNISGHRVTWISYLGSPQQLLLYNGNTEQTTVLAEEGGPLGAPGFSAGEDYDHPHQVFAAGVDVGSGLWLMNVVTGEAVDFVDAIAPLSFSGEFPEVSDGFAAFTAFDPANSRSVVAIYDIDRDKVRIIASYGQGQNGFPNDVHISGPNLVWTVSEFLEEPPFVINSVAVAYRLDEYIKILLGL